MGDDARMPYWDDPDTALCPDPGTEADFNVENNPFAFSPGQLNKLLNPKSLAAFKALGGLKGIEEGLRTDLKSGLSSDETLLSGTAAFEDAAAPGRSHARGLIADQDSTSRQQEAFADRKRVFHDNKLPSKKPKPLLELIWIAYCDKTLLLLSVAAVVSLALGLYHTYSLPNSQRGRPEWIEGVAIVVAILVKAIYGAVNDWHKEQTFVKLNIKKHDRTVRVVRSGKSQIISAYDILCGDVLFLEPGDVIPADGILIDGFNVKCDESSATGESDIVRKQAAGAPSNDTLNSPRFDPFIISGSKVVEGVGTFLVTATGRHSSWGKVVMSLVDQLEAESTASVSFNLAATLPIVMASLRGAASTALRSLRAYRPVGNATAIRSDKIKPHTKEQMRVVAACYDTGCLGTNSGSEERLVDGVEDDGWAGLSSNQHIKELLSDSIALNSTAFEGGDDGEPTFIGSKTEVALLNLPRITFHWIASPNDEHQLKSFKFSLSTVAGRQISVLLSKCDQSSQSGINMDPRAVMCRMKATAESYSADLRTIGLAYRDLDSFTEASDADFDDLFTNMTYIATFGIRDPLRPILSNSSDSEARSKAGVRIRMVTGDNLITARVIAAECGISIPSTSNLRPDRENVEPASRLRVLARSSPDDKRALVRYLKDLGETVAVPGDGTSAALKAADVGFSMGVAGTEVAKEASAIILMDDNFASIVNTLSWSRLVNDATRLFLQYHVFPLALFASISVAIAGVDAAAPWLFASLIVWVNLIMDIFAASASNTNIQKDHSTRTLHPFRSIISHLRVKDHRKFTLAGITLTFATPLVAAIVIPLSDALRIGTGVGAAGTAVAVIPLRTVDGVSEISWTILYVLWAISFSLYLWMQHRLIPHEARHRRKFFLFCVLLSTIHFSVGISAQSSTTIEDGFTIYGPIIATACVYLMSLLFASRVDGEPNGGIPPNDATPGQGGIWSMTLAMFGL